MDKLLPKAYAVVGVIMVALLAYYFVRYRVDVTTEMPKMGCEQVQVLENSIVLGERGARDGWSGELPIDGVTGKYCHLAFYSNHQIVDIYHGDDLIYSMEPSPKNAFAKTPGCVWNDVLLTEDMNGSNLRIVLTPVYHSFSYATPDFYVGEKGSIVLRFLSHELGTALVSIMLMLVGLGMIGYVIYNRKNSEVDKDLALLGGVAVFVGMWRATDISLAKLLFAGLPVFSLLPFMAIMLIAIPFVLFMMNLYNAQGQKLWYLPCYISLFVIALCLFLQYFNLADFRQMFSWILAQLTFAIVVMVLMAVREIIRNGWNAKIRNNILGMALVVVGFSIDVGTYYLTKGKQSVTSYVIMGFLLYTVALGVSIFRENGLLISAGKGAKNMESLAYHDKMTGLFNRAAFIVDTDPYVVDAENFVVAVLDLNNLKACNDTLGHEAGDKYIRDASKIIQSTFGTIGNCYRMGGDEFYCLIPKGGKASCREQQTRMENMIDDYNKTSEDVKIAIACGFARYDNRIDYDLNSTAKRADQLMYQNKEEMKKQEHELELEREELERIAQEDMWE